MFEKLFGAPPGYDALVLKNRLEKLQKVFFIASNDIRANFLQEMLTFVDPDIDILMLPGWDTVPYDRSAPHKDILGTRIDTLCRLLDENGRNPRIVIATSGAVIQKLPPKSFFSGKTLTVKIGQTLAFDALITFLANNSYTRTDTVMENGEFAVRGGLIDVYPAGADAPVRVDFFGDTVDTIKAFSVVTQRSSAEIKDFTLKPVAEFSLNDTSISLFRERYRDLFETSAGDYFYESVSAGRYVQGLEHYLPLFHEKMATVFDYISGYAIISDFQIDSFLDAKIGQINEYYNARIEGLQNKISTDMPYRPIPPELFFLTKNTLELEFKKFPTYELSPFLQSDKAKGGRLGHDFANVRLQKNKDVFDGVAEFIRAAGKKVIVSASSNGASLRLSGLLRDRGLDIHPADSWKDALKKNTASIVAPFEKGFQDDTFIVITETDILGDRLIRPVKKRKGAEAILDVTTLNPNDLVVHQTHGIGRFDSLITLQISGIKHDCLLVVYQDGDKLFVPVENADVLSRYGSGENVSLDKLGSSVFLTRKEKVKKDLFVMAEQLLTTASARALETTPQILAPHGMYQEFCARFPYTETDDQMNAIGDVENDLAKQKPMDRLICGDVGFGKTEVALRAAFLVAMSGRQVAVVVPTTLLARQHHRVFMERFNGFPLRVDALSRLTPVARAKQIHAELEKGTLDIVIGTHALLSKSVKFKNLGMVIIDEEQHFGVVHKERLKELKSGIHVLTLTATPIPRTLQLSMAGVRDLSIIATPPVDRLAVKTFVLPFDGVIVKEAIMREYFRGGQIFYVTPKISDMPEIKDILSRLVPQIKVVSAHGQMAGGQLEKIMTDFTEKKYDLLLSTSIIESGLDMPGVNTMIVSHADMFGLSALYQMRGRVGRGKIQGYTYLTTPTYARIGDTAQKRLTVMQSLDSLGAGFALASHDLDIRGAGNLLGDEQSGHIREIGVSLYQKMLSDAVRALKEKAAGEKTH
ncbi:MAG: transcription-repair coupling factor, partial [Lactobacillales bacterium]|nr:transcription-repair coupling factor [Lactobacillales bacterium]